MHFHQYVIFNFHDNSLGLGGFFPPEWWIFLWFFSPRGSLTHTAWTLMAWIALREQCLHSDTLSTVTKLTCFHKTVNWVTEKCQPNQLQTFQLNQNDWFIRPVHIQFSEIEFPPYPPALIHSPTHTRLSTVQNLVQLSSSTGKWDPRPGWNL